FTGEVVKHSFGPGYVELSLRDRTFSWIEEYLPNLITHDVFDWVDSKDEGGWLNIIFGQCRTPELSEPGPLGQVPVPHMGLPVGVDGGDRFGLACHPVEDVIALYRRERITVNDDSQTEWVLVDVEEYNVIEEDFEAFGITFSGTFIDFFDI